MKPIKKEVKTKDGKIHESCPDIDAIQEFLYANQDKFPLEEIFETNQRLERVRKINSSLREALNNAFTKDNYNFSAILKTLKIKFKEQPEVLSLIDETIKTYL